MMSCQRGGSLSLTTRDITLKECRSVTTLKYLLRKLVNRLHYILNDPRNPTQGKEDMALHEQTRQNRICCCRLFITKTCLYNFDPLKPLFYIIKMGFTGVYIIFLISTQNIYCGYSLEPPRRGGSNVYPQYMFWAEIWKISEFFIWKFSFFDRKIFSTFE